MRFSREVWFFIGLTFLIYISACNSGKTSNFEIEHGKIYVIYFHTDRSCEVCSNIESRLPEILINKYSIQLLNGSMIYKSLSLNEKENLTLAKNLGLGGQSLIILKDSVQINLIAEAMMYVVNDLDEFESIISFQIDKILNSAESVE